MIPMVNIVGGLLITTFGYALVKIDGYKPYLPLIVMARTIQYGLFDVWDKPEIYNLMVKLRWERIEIWKRVGKNEF